MKSTLANAAPAAKPQSSTVALSHDAQPLLPQRGSELQPYGTLTRLPLGLSDRVRLVSSTDVLGEAE